MKNILAFFAHPDDETMLCGGTLATLSHLDVQIHYLCATRGEGGELGEPPICTRAELGKTREKELICAVEALGGSSLAFLDYVDPLVSADDTLFAFDADLPTLAEQIKDHICKVRAQVVITHGSNGEYGHPGHLFAHVAAVRAVSSFGNDPPLLYTMQADFPDHPKPRLSNKDDPADLVLDIKHVLEQKTRAAFCHRSQHALFVRRASEKAGRKMSIPEVMMPIESLHRAIPANGKPPLDILSNLLMGTNFVINH
ncbi:MAG: PIG-L family deacetylase [Anaerolineaceae bacterium]|nr:PIG-L family deacetylase [Anaerolineaceae bacterium]